MERKIKIYLFTTFYLISIFSCKYLDPLYWYENAWNKKDISFFQKKINTFPDGSLEDVYNADIYLSEVSYIFYVDLEFFKRVKYKNEYEKFIKANSYFFWKQFFKSEEIFNINKSILLPQFFIYDRYYTEEEKDSIIKISNTILFENK